MLQLRNSLFAWNSLKYRSHKNFIGCIGNKECSRRKQERNVVDASEENDDIEKYAGVETYMNYPEKEKLCGLDFSFSRILDRLRYFQMDQCSATCTTECKNK